MPHNTEISIGWRDTDAGGLIYYPYFFSLCGSRNK
jgi:acyl-CoA thioesterase FadM